MASSSTTSSSSNTSDLVFSFTFGYPEYANGEKQTVFYMNSLKAPQFESEERSSRAPVDIVCVIDKSGSMSGEKIELVKKTLQFMVDQLKHGDRIALVTFDTDITTDLNLTEMSEKGKTTAKSAITALRAGTCTNLSGGLFQGFELVKKREKPNDVISVLLFTDGLANAGLTSTPQIVAGIQKFYQELGTACSLFTFGFGQDHDANMLRAIAEAGNGLYYYIQKEDEIPESFANCLGGLMSVVAQNIKLSLTCASEGVRIVKMLSKYKNVEIQKEKQIEVSVGDLYSEEQRDIIFEVEIPAVTEQSNYPVLKVTLSYFNVVTTSLKSGDLVAIVNRPAVVHSGLPVNIELDKQRNRLISAQALDEGRKLADNNKLEEGRNVINEAIKKISNSASASDPFCKGLVTDLQECLSNMIDRVSYTSVGSKMMNNYYSSNTYQRQTSSKSAAQQTYTTSSKVMMSERAKKL